MATISDFNNCRYCGSDTSFSTRYQVLKAVKPPAARKRLKHIGYCCELCHDRGETVYFDPWKQGAKTNG